MGVATSIDLAERAGADLAVEFKTTSHADLGARHFVLI